MPGISPELIVLIVLLSVLTEMAGVVAVQNAGLPEELRVSLAPWAGFFGMSADELQAMAVFGEKQRERVQSLAGRLTR